MSDARSTHPPALAGPGKGAATASGPWSMSKTPTAWCEQRWWARLDLRGVCLISSRRQHRLTAA